MISQKQKGWRNPWVAGLALIVIAGVIINARMLWNVMNHPTRLLDEKYTVRGHNQHDAKWVQQQAERSTLGWQASLHSPQRLANDPLATGDSARFILLGTPAQLQFGLLDKEGEPVQGAIVEIEAQWPGDPKFDLKLKLNELSSGHYEGAISFSRSGNWDLLIKVDQNGQIFEMEQKVFVAFAK
jgi:hypothetical protein